MGISYRTVSIDDLDDVFHLVENAIKQMEADNIHQWDSLYPTKEDFNNDIKENQLYVGTVNGEIVVIYVLNREFEEEYKNGKWQCITENFYIIHRLCVSPKFQKQGIAGTTLRHIENELKLIGADSIRLDVFSENPYALRLYINNGYKKVGTANWRKGEFYLMEKIL